MLMTKQRALIYNIVTKMSGHLTADEIFILAKKEMPSIALATVYNNLNALYNSGQIGKVTVSSSADLYDRSPIPHGHVMCKKCNFVQDINIPDLTGIIENSLGEKIESYNLSIDYVCKNCQKTTC